MFGFSLTTSLIVFMLWKKRKKGRMKVGGEGNRRRRRRGREEGASGGVAGGVGAVGYPAPRQLRRRRREWTMWRKRR